MCSQLAVRLGKKYNLHALCFLAFALIHYVHYLNKTLKLLLNDQHDYCQITTHLAGLERCEEQPPGTPGGHTAPAEAHGREYHAWPAHHD